MKKTLLALTVLGSTLSAAVAAPDIGVSVDIRQPGVYGRIDIGARPPPPLVYAQPIMVSPPRVVVQRQPIYLYVPPGHQKKWSKHCARYNACHQPVYFVQERWVEDRWQARHAGGETRHHGVDRGYRVAPGGRESRQERDAGQDGYGKKHGKGHGKKHDKQRGRGEDDDRGQGHGQGHGR